MKISRVLYFLFAAAALIVTIVSCLNARSLSDENKILKALAEQENKSNSRKQKASFKQETEIAVPSVHKSENTQPEDLQYDTKDTAENKTEIAEPDNKESENIQSENHEIEITETMYSETKNTESDNIEINNSETVNNNAQIADTQDHETEVTEPIVSKTDSAESDTDKNENDISVISDNNEIGKDHGEYVIIINKKTKKYHTGKCRAAQNTGNNNRWEYHVETPGGSEEDRRYLESLGYNRCGICK